MVLVLWELGRTAVRKLDENVAKLWPSCGQVVALQANVLAHVTWSAGLDFFRDHQDKPALCRIENA